MRGGEDMYQRRGGLSYVMCIIRFKRHLRKIGFIGMGSFLFSTVAHSVVSIVPNDVRTFIYSKLLRKGNK